MRKRNKQGDHFSIVYLRDFWNDTACRFGSKDNCRTVLFPTAYGLLNRYTDFLQRSALKGSLEELCGKKVLDLGCGIGRWTERLANSGASVVGLDFSKEMVNRAKKRLSEKDVSSSDFILASASELPFASKVFDAILSVTVLQHIVNERAFRLAASEIIRATKPQGTLIMLEFNAANNYFNSEFPMESHRYLEAFICERGLSLSSIRGVDISLFLKPFLRVMMQHGRYGNQLRGGRASEKRAILSEVFYLITSIACIISLPIDLAFRNLFPLCSQHKIYILKPQT